MALGEKTICVYVPQELFEAVDEDAYKKGSSRSNYVKELLLEHLSKGNDKIRIKLLGREKGRKK
jgi:metal-responsive CopG/Arc/MetJ family transcriptional regulator